MLRKWILNLGLAAAVGAGAAGCESHAGNGALIGGAAGAGIGAIIGHNSHDRTAEGALIGGAVGALGGGLIGNEQDKAERRRYDDGRRTRYERDDYYDYAESRYDAPPPARYERSERAYGGDGYYESRTYRSSNGPYGTSSSSSTYYESRRYGGY